MMKPPPRPTLSISRRVSSRIACGVPNGSSFCTLIPPKKVNLSSELLLHFVGIHHLGLEGIEHVQPQLDQLGKQLLHAAAGVDQYGLARPLDHAVHPRQPRLDEPPPQRAAEDQSVLLAPVVAELHAVDVVAQDLFQNATIGRRRSRRTIRRRTRALPACRSSTWSCRAATMPARTTKRESLT